MPDDAGERPIGAFIVDDEPDLRLLVRMGIELRNEGLFVVGEAASGTAALEMIDEADPAVVVLDQMMPGIDGLETAARILDRRPEQKIVLFSAFLDDEIRRSALERGVSACVPKQRLKELPDILLDLGRAATA